MSLHGKTAHFLFLFCIVSFCSQSTIGAAGQKESTPRKENCQFSKKQIIENPLNCDYIRSIEEWKQIWGNPVSSDTVVGPPEAGEKNYHLLWIYLNYKFGQAIFVKETGGKNAIFTTVHIVRDCKDCLKCGIAIGDSVGRIERILAEPDSVGGDSILHYASEGAELKFFVRNDVVKEILYLPFWE